MHIVHTSPSSPRPGTRRRTSSSGGSTRTRRRPSSFLRHEPRRSEEDPRSALPGRPNVVLGVIDRLAELDRSDVVPRSGRAWGVPTTFLDRVNHVHAIELIAAPSSRCERRWRAGERRPRLRGRARLRPRPPRPRRRSSWQVNLPYNVATPIVAETLTAGAPIQSWCVMVQREVAERFFAEPGTKAYGAVSVVVQPARRTASTPSRERSSGRRRTSIPRWSASSASRPRRTRRACSASPEGHSLLTQDARGTRSLWWASPPVSGSVTALDTIGRAADVRAEALAPEEPVRLAEALGS